MRTNRLNRPKEIGFDRIKHFIDTINRQVEFYITGGEPFVRKDCCSIIEYIKSKGFSCGVNTNGLLLDRPAADRLIAAGLDYIVFSLHGPQKIHDQAMGKSQAFKLLIRNLKYFVRRKEKTEVIASCTINPLNIPYLDKVYSIAEGLGADRMLYEHLQFLNEKEMRTHRKAWKKYFRTPGSIITPKRFFREPVDTELLWQKLDEIKNNAAGRGARPEVRPLLSKEGLNDWYNSDGPSGGRCGAIFKKIVISPSGDVRICQLYNKVVSNIARQSFREIISLPAYRAFNDALVKNGGLFPGCLRCCHRFKITPLF